jgi:alcohol dehydrogenase
MRALQLVAPQQFNWIELAEPGPPGPGEALVAVRAMGVCGTDISGWLGKMPFITFPRLLGHELGVEVLAIGSGVDHVQPGDRCAVEPYLNCGDCHACRQGRTNCCETLEVLGVHVDGGLRERWRLPARRLHPDNSLDFEQLALVETLAIGCHAVDRAALTASEDVLIVGAGPIGLSVLEFARLASDSVTVLENSAARRAFVERHYPGVTAVAELADTPCAQVVIDATGNTMAMARAPRFARFTGRVVYVGITAEPVPLNDPLFHRRELTLLASRNARSADFPRILDLIRSGRIDTRPWISHRAAWTDLPAALPAWTRPGSGVVKAVVEVG